MEDFVLKIYIQLIFINKLFTMKKIVSTIVLVVFSVFCFSQKVVKMYFKGNHLLSLDHQVDPKTGVENGYYKQYDYSGRLLEEGFYRMGRKNGTWKKYNNYGKVNSVITYKNDTLNGIYKGWCGDDEWMCQEYVYKNGETIKEKTYYKNGKLEWDIDKEKSIYNHFSIKGEALQKTINGKTFFYSVNQDGEIEDLENIKFDSIGYKYEYVYYTIWDNGKKIKRVLNRVIKKKNDKIIEDYGFYPYPKEPLIAEMYSNNNDINDSALFSNGCILYLSDPNPNSEKNGINYDIKKGLTIDNSLIKCCLVAGSYAYKMAQIEYIKKMYKIIDTLYTIQIDDFSGNVSFVHKENGSLIYFRFKPEDIKVLNYEKYESDYKTCIENVEFSFFYIEQNQKIPISIYTIFDRDNKGDYLEPRFKCRQEPKKSILYKK